METFQNVRSSGGTAVTAHILQSNVAATTNTTQLWGTRNCLYWTIKCGNEFIVECLILVHFIFQFIVLVIIIIHRDHHGSGGETPGATASVNLYSLFDHKQKDFILFTDLHSFGTQNSARTDKKRLSVPRNSISINEVRLLKRWRWVYYCPTYDEHRHKMILNF